MKTRALATVLLCVLSVTLGQAPPPPPRGPGGPPPPPPPSQPSPPPAPSSPPSRSPPPSPRPTRSPSIPIPAAPAGLSQDDYNTIRSAIIDAFNFRPTYGMRCAPCTDGDNVGALLRLVFHDAVGGGVTAASVGTNGCIDLSAPGNAGLSQAMAILDTAWAPFSSLVSRADFWVIAANIAVEFATTPRDGAPELANLPIVTDRLVLPLHLGRVDTTSCTDSPPAVTSSWATTMGVFGAMGLSLEQTVALFGAHAVGRAEAANSGIDGGWTQTQATFANTYFARFFGIPWDNADGDAVWRNPATNNILLQADVEVGISPADGCVRFGGAGALRGLCARNAATLPAVTRYATDNAAWWADFSTAWQVMTEFGYHVDATTQTLVPNTP